MDKHACKKTTGLRYLVTFFPAHTMFVDDKVDVVDNVLLADRRRYYIITMGKQKTHFLHIIADSSFCILFGHKGVVQLLQATLCRLR
jgi:hypothetical protein